MGGEKRTLYIVVGACLFGKGFIFQFISVCTLSSGKLQAWREEESEMRERLFHSFRRVLCHFSLWKQTVKTIELNLRQQCNCSEH
jgi:hypothetical protein